MAIRPTACVLLLCAVFCRADPPGASEAQTLPPLAKSVRDPATGVTYYLASDRQHMFAMTAKGVILWTRYLAETGLAPREQVTDFTLADPEWWYFKKDHHQAQDYLQVSCGFAFGVINKNTGQVTMLGSD
jgi:hypothetical protein